MFSKITLKRVLAVATSVVAAQLLDQCQATHSALKLPIFVHSDRTCNIKAYFQLPNYRNKPEL